MDTLPDRETFNRLIAEANDIQFRIDVLLPGILNARRAFMRTRSDADRAEMERLEQQADELVKRHGALAEPLRLAAGLSEEEVAELDKPRISGDGENRMLRDSLRREMVKITACFDSCLEDAVSALSSLVPPGWADEQSEVGHGLDSLHSGSDCLSIVKGL